MFNYEIYDLLLKQKEKKPLEDYEQQYLDEMLTKAEQRHLGKIALALHRARTFDALLAVLDHHPDSLEKMYHIDSDTLARWERGGMTPFERSALEFIFVHEAFDEERVHLCPICGCIHLEWGTHWEICHDCWSTLDEKGKQTVLSHEVNDHET